MNTAYSFTKNQIYRVCAGQTSTLNSVLHFYCRSSDARVAMGDAGAGDAVFSVAADAESADV